KISQTSEIPITIEFNKKVLEKDSIEYQTLLNSMKKKKARIEKYRSKK
ncbi:14989_t:CDS:1, partial [Funneliformis caledonium]